MFEGLYLKKNLVEYQNKHLKERVRELNEFPFGYKTVDGFNSELMLMEKK